MRRLIASVLIYSSVLATSQGGPLHEAAKTGDLAASKYPPAKPGALRM